MAQYPRIPVSPANNELWKRGDLRHILLPHKQTQLYDFYHSVPEEEGHVVVFECHRRMGKTFLQLVLAVEQCLRHPNYLHKYATPTFEQAKDIIVNIMPEVLRSCPASLQPKKAGKAYVFPNGSRIQIYGVESDQGNRMRGGFCDSAAFDEVREMTNHIAILADVLSYQFVGRKHQKCIIMTTPPHSMEHPFITKSIPGAIAAKTFKRVRGSENRDFDQDDERIILNVHKALGIEGGKQSDSWRREVECEHIRDDSFAVTPEFEHSRHVKTVDFPQFWVPIEGIDFGWRDHTAVVFGYVDFQQQKLVIIDEIFANMTTTSDLADMIKDKEELHFKDNPHKIRRYGDHNLQQIADLHKQHGIYIQKADKYSKDDSIATLPLLRSGLSVDKVVVHPRCQHTIRQLADGVWKDPNAKNKDYDRTEGMGHLDCIDALKYLYKMAPWNFNPYIAPDRGHRRIATDTFHREDNTPKTESIKQLKKLK